MLQAQVENAKTILADRLAEMNEVRQQINRERGQFELREHAEAKLQAMEVRIASIEKSYSNLAGRILGVGTGFTVFIILINLAISFWRK